MHATAYLKKPEAHETGPVVAIYGEERALKLSVVRALIDTVLQGDDAGLTRFPARDLDFRTLADELRTVSMWGDKRLVVVEDADDFVSANRAALEGYMQKPARKSVLVLDVKTWMKTTKLAKIVDKDGLAVQCSTLQGKELVRWLVDASRETHECQLLPDAAQLMVELAGEGLGLLEQEVAKLAAYVGDRKRIEADDVRALVGGWKAETTWAMLDAVRDGNLGQGIACLEKLLVAGEPAPKLLGGVNFVFRKLARATELSRGGMPLAAALKQAAVFPRDVQRSEQYLRRIGRARAECILPWLVEADINLKGGSRLPERLQMELLLVRLGGGTEAAPRVVVDV